MPDHVHPLQSGIAARHRDAIEAIMQERNCFLFVRPTEYDSTILIEEGFATKSMDIHDKSSNWGPMAGMVPCDPAFNKKASGIPNPSPHYHAHGEAVPVKLELPWSLYQRFLGDARKLSVLPNRYFLSADGTVASRATSSPTGPEVALQARTRFVTALPQATQGPRSTIFCLQGLEGGAQSVSWVNWNTERTVGTLVPIWVWAYTIEGQTRPVTGDYDLWMVAPHLSSWGSHVLANAIEDEHGKSTASRYTVGLAEQMNAACKKAAPNTNRVFNHGAEAQNYAFTQALDSRLVMFTPSGVSRMVDMSDMPAVLADLVAMGYFVIQNKRYEELDPRIMNTSAIKPIARLEAARKANEERAKKGEPAEPLPMAGMIAGIAQRSVTRTRFRKALQDLRAAKAAKAPGLATSRWGLVRAAVNHGFEPARMVMFRDDLHELLASAGTTPKFLAMTDFPDTVRRLSDTVRRIQQAMQAAAVDATVGSGQTDDDVYNERFNNWAMENDIDLDALFMALVQVDGGPG